MARPKKSITQKQAQGTLRPSRENVIIDLCPMSEKPKVPDYLVDFEREFYERVTTSLFNDNVLREVDLFAIEMSATWWQVFKASREDVLKSATQESANGYNQIKGSLTAIREASKNLQWLSQNYGLNPISKDKISAPPPKDMKAEKLKRMAR